jgi:hypothetical protein
MFLRVSLNTKKKDTMNITILNGDLRPANDEFDRFLHSYRMKLSRTGQYVRSFRLSDLQIPGMTDRAEIAENIAALPVGDFRYIRNTLEDTDLFILAGTPGPLTVIPAIKMLGEKLHQRGYKSGSSFSSVNREHTEKFPMIGLILNKQAGVNEHDLLLNRLAAERMAANLHAVFSFCATTEAGSYQAACLTLQSFDYQEYLEKTCDDLILGAV